MGVRRYAAALAATVLSVVALAIPAHAQDAAQLRVCTPGDYPPYAVADGNGGYRGVDIELTRGLAEMIRRPVRFVPTTWASLKTDFAALHCDLAVGGISDSPARREYADFSVAYGTDGKAPITRAENADEYATIDRINRPEVRVIVNRGGTNETFARTHFPDAHLILWPDNITIFDQLTQGNADVFVTDAVEGRYRTRLHPGLVVLHPDHPFDSFDKIFLIRENDPLLAAEVNTWLTIQRLTGGIDRLFADWIGPHATA
ncbi:transporter substrate-binding domain-containing protein [Nocardia sp. CDC159]|uniref:Transporter substrate-binding domain-containing protein n=1 Tax=Nocardia pulmonis TaxID=2951408 RepID=A0A9X2E9D0_9NOCA|nr:MULTISPECIES: transporter substrate-binding domain-containing protein [Nocardia]MCM6776699.1 transporter substrate-binding domain-containing protein [Nocardia pulmonis]MCM6789152.1 transporter substrate-binding domain-containing protein [Nocardia sp. CDC159]